MTLDGSASHDAERELDHLLMDPDRRAECGAELGDGGETSVHGADVAASLSFSLTVNDGQSSSTSATAIVTVMNHAPVGSAGADATVAANAPVALDGAGSSDADGDPLTYKWVQTAGPSVSLSSSSSANPTFVAPNSAAVLQFTLVVNDGEAIRPVRW